MKKYTRLTFITSAMILLSSQAVFAQTNTDEKPSEVTTSEVTTVAPTTQEETTTTTTEQVRTRRKREVSNEETQSKEVEKSTYTGFVTRDGVTYYHINKVPITRQWKQIDQKWYYFDEEGKMVTGWIKHKMTWYYLDRKNGNMVSNAFIQSADKTGWYYIKQDGTMADKPEFEIEPDGLITTK